MVRVEATTIKQCISSHMKRFNYALLLSSSIHIAGITITRFRMPFNVRKTKAKTLDKQICST